MKLEEALKTNKFRNEVHKATLNIMYTAYWMRSHLSSALKSKGVTIEQFNIMRILKGKYPEAMCVKDIGSRVLEKSSNVPRIIDRLVAKKLVKRATSKLDKRETLITITENGLALLDEMSVLVEQCTEDILELEESDAAIVNAILEKMKKKD